MSFGEQAGVKIKGWYVELYDPIGTRAKCFMVLKDFSAVKSLIATTRSEKTGELVRVLAPPDADRKDLSELENMGAKRL